MLQTQTTAAPALPLTLSLAQALNQKIRELLDRERLSQREFAQQLGMTQGAVSYLLAEKRRASVLDWYQRLAHVAFGTSLSELVKDLEDRVGQLKGAANAPSSRSAGPSESDRSVFVSHAAGSAKSVVALGVVLDALIDATYREAQIRIERQVEAAHAELVARLDAASTKIAANVAAVIAERDQAERRHPDTRASRRRRPAPKKRADDRAARGAVVRAGAVDGEALPAGRDPSGGDLRRAG